MRGTARPPRSIVFRAALKGGACVTTKFSLATLGRRISLTRSMCSSVPSPKLCVRDKAEALRTAVRDNDDARKRVAHWGARWVRPLRRFLAASRKP